MHVTLGALWSHCPVIVSSYISGVLNPNKYTGIFFKISYYSYIIFQTIFFVVKSCVALNRY